MTAMDFRQYDNSIGRFNGIDKLSELDYSGSPYSFGFNNPVYFSDPSGLTPLSDLPDYVQAMWFATPNGTNSKWLNDGFGNFDNADGSSFINSNGFFFLNQEISGGGGGGFHVVLPTMKIFVNSSGLLHQQQNHVYENSPFYSKGNNSKYNHGWGNAPSGWDMGNGAIGTYLSALEIYATANSAKTYKYGTQLISATSLTTANTARMLNIAKGAQVFGNTLGFVSGGVSLYNAYDEYTTTGNVNYKSIVDGSVSIIGASAGTAMMFGVLASNPIGWAVLGGIATGAAIYGVVSFGIDMYNAKD